MEFYVKDIMTTDLITIKENTTIRDAIKIFSANDISGLPVLDQDNTLVGLLSKSDILYNESSHSFYYLPFQKEMEMKFLEDSKFFDRTVSSIMSKDLHSIKPNASIAEMSRKMYENKIHRLVVTEYGKLIGIVTTYDLLKLLAEKG